MSTYTPEPKPDLDWDALVKAVLSLDPSPPDPLADLPDQLSSAIWCPDCCPPDPLADLCEIELASGWPFEVKSWPETMQAVHSEWYDPKPFTFTVPIRTRERVVIPPGALVRANPMLLRRLA